MTVTVTIASEIYLKTAKELYTPYFSLFFPRRFSASTITAKLTNQFQWSTYNTISEHYSLDPKDDFYSSPVVESSLNNSSFQNYPHPDDYTK